jgi:flagellar motor switch protein FliN/FliY
MTHDHSVAPEAAFANELAASVEAFASSLEATSPRGATPVTADSAPPRVQKDVLMDIPVSVRVVIGCATLSIAELSALAKNSVVTLDRKLGELADLYVNGRPFARGEIVLVDEVTQRLGFAVKQLHPVAQS